MNCLARLIGGIILDNLRFKYYFGMILTSSILISLTFSLVAHNRIAFLIYLAFTYYISGSVFVSIPVFFGKIFGPEIGSQSYAYLFTSNALTCISFS